MTFEEHLPWPAGLHLEKPHGYLVQVSCSAALSFPKLALHFAVGVEQESL